MGGLQQSRKPELRLQSFSQNGLLPPPAYAAAVDRYWRYYDNEDERFKIITKMLTSCITVTACPPLLWLPPGRPRQPPRPPPCAPPPPVRASPRPRPCTNTFTQAAVASPTPQTITFIHYAYMTCHYEASRGLQIFSHHNKHWTNRFKLQFDYLDI